MAIGSETPSLRDEDRAFLMAMADIMSFVLERQEPFCLAVSLRQTKTFSSAPSASAVKTLFWTSMI
jgi:hypothetical protein